MTEGASQGGTQTGGGTTTTTTTTPTLTTYSMGAGFKQSQLLLFEKNYIRALNQTKSLLLHTPAIQHMDIKGITNMSTIAGVELSEVTDKGSNPDKVYTEMSTKNRKSVQRRFTKTYLFDDYDKCVNLIKDPESDLFLNLKEAMERMSDKCINDAAIAPVYIGSPNDVPEVVSAADDGVMTIDGKAGFSYSRVISPAITMFTNNYVNCSSGVTLAISGAEQQALRDDDKYMNALYSSSNTVDKGTITNASGFQVVTFAGTQNGVSEIELPILEEKDGFRTNLFLAPNSIAFAVELGRLDVCKSATKVNSWEVTIDVWVKTVRRQGKRVIKAISTM